MPTEDRNHHSPSGRGGRESPVVSDEVLRRSQFAQLIRQVPVMTSVSALNALLILVYLGGSSPTPAMVAWTLAIVVPSLWSLMRWVRARRRMAWKDRPVSARTMRHAMFWNVAMGTFWGATGFIFFPHSDVVGHVLVAFVVGGMMAGMVVTLYPMPRNLFVFGFLSIVPTAGLLLVQQTALERGMGILLFIFAGALAAVVRLAYRHFKTSLAIRTALSEARDLLHDAIARSGEAFAIFDADGQIVVANDLFSELFPEGVVPAAPMGEPVVERLPDGRWVKGTTSRMKSGGSVSAYADITELKEQEAQLIEARHAAESASRAKSQFLAVMSHELRTPLNSIIGFAELIADTEAEMEEETVREYARYILKSGCHLLGLISDILDLTRLDSGKAVQQDESLDLAVIVADVVAQMRPEAARAGLELELGSLDDVTIRADARSVRQILFNLIANAIKFTERGGHIRVSLGVAGETVELVVEDSGIGISGDDMEQIFEPFRQVESGLSREGGGIGLGLALVRKLAEAQGGSVSVESALGEGSRFTVRLPTVAHRQNGVGNLAPA